MFQLSHSGGTRISIKISMLIWVIQLSDAQGEGIFLWPE